MKECLLKFNCEAYGENLCLTTACYIFATCHIRVLVGTMYLF